MNGQGSCSRQPRPYVLLSQARLAAQVLGARALLVQEDAPRDELRRAVRVRGHLQKTATHAHVLLKLADAQEFIDSPQKTLGRDKQEDLHFTANWGFSLSVQSLNIIKPER